MTFAERCEYDKLMSKKKLLGKTFGWLQVLEFDHDEVVTKRTYTKTKYYWKCKCTRCGKIVVVNGSDLTTGHSTSCGCLNADRIANGLHTTHNLTYHRLYNVHGSMIDRCYRVNSKSYKRYGARGIRICDEWYTPGIKGNPGLVNFIQWAYNNGYYDQPNGTPRGEILSIERKDYHGNYEPGNCTWIKLRDQASNTRNNHKIYYMGDYYNIADLKNIEPTVGFISNRLRKGWPESAISMALMKPEIGLHRENGIYKDNDGFTVLIPKIKKD